MTISFILSLLCLYTVCEVSAAPIKFGFNTSFSPPLVFQFENQNMNLLTGGFIYEISTAIADDLHLDYTFAGMTSVGIDDELVKGNIDLDCYDSQTWEAGSNIDTLWSKTLYSYSNVLVGKKEIPFKRQSDIANITIGTIEKNIYPDLEESFKTKGIKRADALSVTANLNKLFANHLDYIVMSDIEYNYYKDVYPKLQRSSFVLDKIDMQCSLSKKSSLPLKKLNETITRLKNKNIFENIYKRYINPKIIITPITYGLNDTNSPPFLIFDDSSKDLPVIKGGVFFDLGLAIGKKLQRPVRFMLSSRKRLDSGLASGRIELVCYNNEAWTGEYAKEYLWSTPIFKHSNYIVSNAGHPGIFKMKSLNDLKGQTLGASLGFIYPSLMPYFKDGSILRDDALSGTANIARLNSGKIPLIILNNIEYMYYKKIYPNMERAPFEFDAIDVKCAISKKSDLKLKDLNSALVDLGKTGNLQKIFK